MNAGEFLWEDDLDEFDELDIDVSYRMAPYDFDRDGHL